MFLNRGFYALPLDKIIKYICMEILISDILNIVHRQANVKNFNSNAAQKSHHLKSGPGLGPWTWEKIHIS